MYTHLKLVGSKIAPTGIIFATYEPAGDLKTALIDKN